NKPCSNYTLVNELYANNIIDEKEILDIIKISDADYEVDLNDDMANIKINQILLLDNNISHLVSSSISSVFSSRSFVSLLRSLVSSLRNFVSSSRSPVLLHNNNSSYLVLIPISSFNNCDFVSSLNNYSLISSPNTYDLVSLPNNCGLVFSPKNSVLL
ncbi:10159_t:CDS:2, partial [Scutellospora calospora]